MPTRNVVLTQHQTALLERLVSSGRYQNASEVMREGLRLIERRDDEDAARLLALRQAVQVGAADIDAGRFTMVASESDLRAHLERLTAKAGTAA